MDRLTRTANIIKAYYSYKKNSDSATFVKEVCGFFDFIKGEPISEADMNFLLFLANEAGVPQYFDLLKDKFTDCRISDENINALTLSALFHDASLIRGNNKLHRYQKNVLDSFTARQQNRFVLTAPTSFGKTFLVYEVIQKMQYQNILLIFPAISLLSENYALPNHTFGAESRISGNVDFCRIIKATSRFFQIPRFCMIHAFLRKSTPLTGRLA